MHLPGICDWLSDSPAEFLSQLLLPVRLPPSGRSNAPDTERCELAPHTLAKDFSREANYCLGSQVKCNFYTKGEIDDAVHTCLHVVMNKNGENGLFCFTFSYKGDVDEQLRQDYVYCICKVKSEIWSTCSLTKMQANICINDINDINKITLAIF